MPAEASWRLLKMKREDNNSLSLILESSDETQMHSYSFKPEILLIRKEDSMV